MSVINLLLLLLLPIIRAAYFPCVRNRILVHLLRHSLLETQLYRVAVYCGWGVDKG